MERNPSWMEAELIQFGSKEEVLKYVERGWVDMRPKSLKDKIDQRI